MGYVVKDPKTKGNLGAGETVRRAEEGTDGFKKGGSCMKKGGKAKKPARASGGGVLSSAAKGEPRGKTAHY